ncbi:HD-GYP domain-containing protein [Actimicrobium antarcticum]|uniref:HD-GYP domain-containing protein n=1 Tax=Actimicrobium antarcticum TaxID=1051899 RepID=A0ABP7SVW2_9BURK
MNDQQLAKKVFKSSLVVSGTELRIGMYVADLDCGWASTPFLLEGIFLATDEDVATVVRLARLVTVDPARSRLSALAHFPQASLYETDLAAATDSKRAAPAEQRLQAFQSAVRKHDGDHANRQERLSLWWRELMGRLSNVLGGLLLKKRLQAVPVSLRPAYIPDDIGLVVYPAAEFTKLALPQALIACDLGEAALERIARDLAEHRDTDVEALQLASETLAENMIRRPGTMIWATKMRDKSNRMYHHGLGVAIYLTALGRQLGFQREQLADLATIGLLLDLGKMDLHADLLDKPGKLNEDETLEMQTHVRRGVSMLETTGVTSEVVLRAIAEHHERVDGQGYPAGLPGNQIAIFGKMAAIADAYDAMVNPRPYAPAYAPYDAMKRLFAESDTRWFGPLVEQFVQAIGIFPVGSLIELSSGEVAIVVQHNAYRRLEPLILILTDSAKLALPQPQELDMLKHNFAAAPKVLRITTGLADGAFGIQMQDYYLKAA